MAQIWKTLSLDDLSSNKTFFSHCHYLSTSEKGTEGCFELWVINKVFWFVLWNWFSAKLKKLQRLVENHTGNLSRYTMIQHLSLDEIINSFYLPACWCQHTMTMKIDNMVKWQHQKYYSSASICTPPNSLQFPNIRLTN